MRISAATVDLWLLDAERLGELAGLIHLPDDVGAAEQLAVDVELREGLPVGDLGRNLAQRLQRRQDVDRPVLDVDGSRICTTRIENPQRGASGVPFMNSSTGFAAISSSTLVFSSGSAIGKEYRAGFAGSDVGGDDADQRDHQCDDRGAERSHRLDHRVIQLVDAAVEPAEASIHPVAEGRHPVADGGDLAVYDADLILQVVEAVVGPGRSHLLHAVQG